MFVFGITCFLSQKVKAQSDVWKRSMFRPDTWTLGIDAFQLKSRVPTANPWFGLTLTHFPIAPNMGGNNALSINTRVCVSPDFRVIQFSTGWVGAAVGSMIVSKYKNMVNDAYSKHRSEGYSDQDANEAVNSEIQMSDDDRGSLATAAFIALECASFHFSFGRWGGISADWNLLNVNHDFKDNSWFISGAVGGSLNVLVAKPLFLRIYSNYVFGYDKSSPVPLKGYNVGGTIGLVIQ